VPKNPHAPLPHNESVLFSNAALAHHRGITVETLRSGQTRSTAPRPRRIGRQPYFLGVEFLDWLRRQPRQGRAADAARVNIATPRRYLPRRSCWPSGIRATARLSEPKSLVRVDCADLPRWIDQQKAGGARTTTTTTPRRFWPGCAPNPKRRPALGYCQSENTASNGGPGSTARRPTQTDTWLT
jgi:hypothetical protein